MTTALAAKKPQMHVSKFHAKSEQYESEKKLAI